MNELREKIEKELSKKASQKIGIDDFYGFQTVVNFVESFIQSQPINKELDSFTDNQDNKLSYQVMQRHDERIKELEKENERVNDLLITQNKLFNEKCDQITQLQKKIEEVKIKSKLQVLNAYYIFIFQSKSIDEVLDKIELDRKYFEALTNKTDEQ